MSCTLKLNLEDPAPKEYFGFEVKHKNNSLKIWPLPLGTKPQLSL